MTMGQLNTRKSWPTLLNELVVEFGRWKIEDYILPQFQDSKDRGVVLVKFAVAGNWATPACSRFTREVHGTQKNLAAILRAVRDARIADQRGIGAILAEVTKHLALPEGGAGHGEDPYGVLGVARGSSVDAMRAVFKARLKAAHPDVGGTNEEFKRVMEAGQALGVA